MLLDTLSDDLILLCNAVNLIVEHVHVVIERVVLLLGLDKASHDLLYACNPSCLAYLGEGVLYDTHVARVDVHQVLLVAVILHPAAHPKLKNGSRIAELSVVSCSSSGIE